MFSKDRPASLRCPSTALTGLFTRTLLACSFWALGNAEDHCSDVSVSRKVWTLMWWGEGFRSAELLVRTRDFQYSMPRWFLLWKLEWEELAMYWVRRLCREKSGWVGGLGLTKLDLILRGVLEVFLWIFCMVWRNISRLFIQNNLRHLSGYLLNLNSLRVCIDPSQQKNKTRGNNQNEDSNLLHSISKNQSPISLRTRWIIPPSEIPQLSNALSSSICIPEKMSLCWSTGFPLPSSILYFRMSTDSVGSTSQSVTVPVSSFTWIFIQYNIYSFTPHTVIDNGAMDVEFMYNQRGVFIQLDILMKKVSQSLAKSLLPPTSHIPKPYTGPSYDQVMADKTKYVAKLYVPYYKKPVMIVEGHGQYLWDHTGKRYLDLTAGISTVNVGHSHPRITKIVKEQVELLTHTTAIFMNQYQAEYSKMLCESLGEGFDSVYLTNSGGEAVDFAMTLAKLYTGCNKFLSLRNAYHGLVGPVSGVTSIGTWNQDMIRGLDHQRLSTPYSYRGMFSKPEDYYRECDDVLQSTSSGRIAAFIAEPVMGVGGIIPLPDGYMKNIFERVRRYNGLCISDEVQTGFGRIGKEMWGFKWQGVKPDIVTIAKAAGNGIPLGAVVTRKEISDSLKKVYFNTFSGGPIQCRVGMEVLKIIQEEKLHQNVEKLSTYFIQRMKAIEPRSKCLGEVRGKGFLIGMEIVKDKNTKEPDLQKHSELMEKTREAGILMSKGGSLGNLIRLQPPLIITKEDLDYTINVLEELLTKD